eukprot:TRINITY_DN9719_c0_g1_i1.p1 TRINITY_DN9719_c0_g1~~TRINITY_DN9719_c0_g1_i1.p1  ORF type:complete len:423 (+),score=104.15 TRINITY_DN9719_c0_g1_i1:46-1314(+)
MSVRASRTGLIPTATTGTTDTSLKKVSSATLARRARSNSPVTHLGVSKVNVVRKEKPVPSGNMLKRSISVTKKGPELQHRPVNSILSQPAMPKAHSHPPLIPEEKPPLQQAFYDSTVTKEDVARLTSSTTEVQELINMYKNLLGKNAGSSLDDSAMHDTSFPEPHVEPEQPPPQNVSKPVHEDPVAAAHQLYMQDTSQEMLDLEEQVSHIERKVHHTEKPKKPNVVYTDYHNQMERVEAELNEARKDRDMLTEQNARLESKCLGMGRELETLRNQHVELHVNTQTTNEKLISYIQGLVKSINELSDRVRTLEAGKAPAAHVGAVPEPETEPQVVLQAAATRTLTVETPSSLVSLHPATPPLGKPPLAGGDISPDESVGTLSSSPSPSYSLRAEIRRQLGAGYPVHGIPTPPQSLDRGSPLPV